MTLKCKIKEVSEIKSDQIHGFDRSEVSERAHVTLIDSSSNSNEIYDVEDDEFQLHEIGTIE